MQAVILAAGKGTRLQPTTLTMSKGMIPIANRPILSWTREWLDFCSEIIIVANKNQKDIIGFFANDKKVKIVYQEEQLGTGNALLAAEHHVKEKFILIYGDDIYGQEDIEGIARMDGNVISTFRHDNPQNYGVVEMSGARVTGLEEKPQHPKSNLVNCGMYLFDRSIFTALKQIKKSPRGEYELTDAVRMLMHGLSAYPIKTWLPITYPWNILDANKYLLDKYGSIIDPLAEIRPGSIIEGPVAIGARAVIGPNCYLRAYSSIGANCKIGQAVEVKNSIIMDNSFASHLSYVGDSIVGRNCNVGGGTLFANLRLDEKNVKIEINGVRVDSGRKKLGAVIGDGVKFGARVTVMPGKRIWPGMMIPSCHTVEEDVKSEISLSKYK